MKVALFALPSGALAALLLATAAPAAAHPASCTAPPAPGGTTRTVADGTRASSFAPHRSRQRSYGAPIPKPLVARHGKGKKKPAPRAPLAPSS